ncbi:MAG: hypothetical protein ACU836_16545 [Gammaproteobacteria bacterium]
MLNTRLLIIDAQNDFCDLPDSYGYTPALPIPGAHQDCLRLARLIRQCGHNISRIIATLDSHHAIDLAHNTSWQDHNGNTVAAFTEIHANDFREGRYRLANQANEKGSEAYMMQYLRNLEQLGRRLTLWPRHCEIGSPGHNFHADLAEALCDWSIRHFKTVEYLQKGLNIWTESFSALKAVIPYPGDDSTELNRALLDSLTGPGRILVAGQASSHCVRETIEDFLRYGNEDLHHKLIMLTDCMSPVSGFEAATELFLNRLPTRGVRLATSEEITTELLTEKS